MTPSAEARPEERRKIRKLQFVLVAFAPKGSSGGLVRRSGKPPVASSHVPYHRHFLLFTLLSPHVSSLPSGLSSFTLYTTSHPLVISHSFRTALHTAYSRKHNFTKALLVNQALPVPLQQETKIRPVLVSQANHPHFPSPFVTLNLGLQTPRDPARLPSKPASLQDYSGASQHATGLRLPIDSEVRGQESISAPNSLCPNSRVKKVLI